MSVDFDRLRTISMSEPERDAREGVEHSSQHLANGASERRSAIMKARDRHFSESTRTQSLGHAAWRQANLVCEISISRGRGHRTLRIEREDPKVSARPEDTVRISDHCEEFIAGQVLHNVLQMNQVDGSRGHSRQVLQCVRPHEPSLPMRASHRDVVGSVVDTENVTESLRCEPTDPLTFSAAEVHDYRVTSGWKRVVDRLVLGPLPPWRVRLLFSENGGVASVQRISILLLSHAKLRTRVRIARSFILADCAGIEFQPIYYAYARGARMPRQLAFVGLVFSGFALTVFASWRLLEKHFLRNRVLFGTRRNESGRIGRQPRIHRTHCRPS